MRHILEQLELVSKKFGIQYQVRCWLLYLAISSEEVMSRYAHKRLSMTWIHHQDNVSPLLIVMYCVPSARVGKLSWRGEALKLYPLGHRHGPGVLHQQLPPLQGDSSVEDLLGLLCSQDGGAAKKILEEAGISFSRYSEDMYHVKVTLPFHLL